ncbi:hypothetical protein ACN20G_08875 [Streptomyces sp. BI20]|uniref:hypothetical protein n=1 Tax=Streptomyces sp. BI20 TaxID=3403460 RepID=UPI003C74B276
MPDRRQSSASSDTPPSDERPGTGGGDADRPASDNPFAAPPADRPDQPWQPRQGADRLPPEQREPAGGPEGTGRGPARWDPTDPLQRRARYAMLAGMWGVFFGVFEIPSMALLLGALALYWGISALRGRRPEPEEGKPAPPPVDPAMTRPQRTAAISGIVGATLAVVVSLATYGVQIAFKDYYVCRADALTQTAELRCNDLLPDNGVGALLRVEQE